ncbi:MAG: hypothetical protein MI807_13490 [Verrucomicrobiales bacterium]|nr:hypothetical protein [Verrucomicrobiales bacterium]
MSASLLSTQASGVLRNFDVGESPHGAITATQPFLPDEVIVGFDSEWVLRGNVNKILSYQVHVRLDGESWEKVYRLSHNEERWTLRTLLKRTLMDAKSDGLFSKYPTSIYLVAHWTLADLVGLEDYNELKKEFDALGKSFMSIMKPYEIRWSDNNRNKRNLSITLRDTLMLAPDGKKSLQSVGDLLDLPKLHMIDYFIERMDLLDRDLPEIFDRYALRDAEITAKYAEKLALTWKRDFGGRSEIPISIGQMAQTFLLDRWDKFSVDKLEVLGKEEFESAEWDNFDGHYRTNTITLPLELPFLHEQLATECFHGGRNESFFFGPTSVDNWTDYDLRSAYTTSLAQLGTPRWQDLKNTCCPDDFNCEVLGGAFVTFEFPDSIRFPCIPVKTANGLIFPLSGKGYATPPEIRLARSLGASLKIISGVIVPMDMNRKPFEPVIDEILRMRKEHDKGSLEELLIKVIGNSIYGKLAQGLNRKRVFDSRSNSRKDSPRSEVTNPYIASYASGEIRAVLGEILNALPPECTVVSCTTDGFITNAPVEAVKAACRGSECSAYSETLRRLTGDHNALEVKHRVRKLLSFRRRGQITLEEGNISPEEDVKPMILAKAGIRPPVSGDKEQNSWMSSQFFKREFHTSFTYTRLPGLAELYRTGGDMVAAEHTRKLGMEYDWGQRPSQVGFDSDLQHVWFTTRPWNSVEEFNNCRKEWVKYSRLKSVVLKDVSSVEGFLDYLATPRVDGVRKGKDATPMKYARTMFLRALKHQMWGLIPERTNSEVVEWLSSIGHRVNKAAVENAKRPNVKIIPKTVPRTPETEKFVQEIKELWPDFEENLFFEDQ